MSESRLISCATFHTLDAIFFFFFFNDTATTEIYTLSLHDALPILLRDDVLLRQRLDALEIGMRLLGVRLHLRHLCLRLADRKSTRLNSSHGYISYAVFCLKKKNKTDVCSSYSVYSAWCLLRQQHVI